MLCSGQCRSQSPITCATNDVQDDLGATRILMVETTIGKKETSHTCAQIQLVDSSGVLWISGGTSMKHGYRCNQRSYRPGCVMRDAWGTPGGMAKALDTGKVVPLARLSIVDRCGQRPGATDPPKRPWCYARPWRVRSESEC